MCSAQNSFRKRSLFAFCFFCGICLQYGFSQTLVMHRNVVPDGYSFWVSTPPDYDSSDAAKPIMLFLHGNSLCGRDLERVRRCGPLHAQAAAVYHTVRKGGTLGAIAPKSGSLFYGFLKKVAHFFVILLAECPGMPPLIPAPTMQGRPLFRQRLSGAGAADQCAAVRGRNL